MGCIGHGASADSGGTYLSLVSGLMSAAWDQPSRGCARSASVGVDAIAAVVEPGGTGRIEYYAALPPVDRPDRDLAAGPKHEPGDPTTDPLVLAHAGVQPVAERVLGDVLLPGQLAAVEVAGGDFVPASRIT